MTSLGPRAPEPDTRLPVIRAARPDEVEAIAEVWTAAGLVSDRDAARRELGTLLGGEVRDPATDLLLVAVVDELVVATVLGTWDGRRGWVQRLATKGEWRGRGVASDLMAEVERRLAARGCRKVNLLVEPENHGVVGLYERLGFRTDELIFMEKWL